MRLRSFTITDLSSDGSAAVTVEAYDNTSALRAYAEECGFETLGELLANRGIEIGDLAVHADYQRASKAHDIEQMLWRLGKTLAEE